MLEHLNQVNDVKICSVFDDCFKTYGRVLTGIDFSPLCDYLTFQTSVPESGNIYVPCPSAP